MVDQIIYYLAHLYSFLPRVIPLGTWVKIGKYLGAILYVIDRKRRHIVIANLRFVFGREKSDTEIYTLARRNYQQLAMTIHEWFWLRHIRRSNIEKLLHLIEVEGRENLDAVKKDGNAVILLGAHFGNWEYSHLYYSSMINRLNFIVRKLDNPFVEKERVSYNQRLGTSILYKESGLKLAIKNLRKGEDLVVFIDQKARSNEGVPGTLLGHPTSTISIISSLSKKYHVPVVPMFIVRLDDDVRHRIVFFPAMEAKANGPEFDIDGFTQLQNDAIERMIRRYPDHWLWRHRRWKTEHSEIYR